MSGLDNLVIGLDNLASGSDHLMPVTENLVSATHNLVSDGDNLVRVRENPEIALENPVSAADNLESATAHPGRETDCRSLKKFRARLSEAGGQKEWDAPTLRRSFSDGCDVLFQSWREATLIGCGWQTDA